MEVQIIRGANCKITHEEIGELLAHFEFSVGQKLIVSEPRKSNREIYGRKSKGEKMRARNKRWS